MDLVRKMREIAKSKPVNIVVCEGWDERCLQATGAILKEGYCNITLLGNPQEINEKAQDIGVDISSATIVDFQQSELKEELAEKLVEIRKHKGLGLEEARELIEDENYFACVYVHAGYADGVAGSAICPTAALMRPALQILREKGKVVSEVAIMTDKDRIFFTSDGSLNIDPTPEQLAQIGTNAASSAKRLGIEPKVAFLSFSTKGSGGDHEHIQTVRDAVDIFKENNPEILVDGEMQVDAAVSPDAAKRKCPNSPLKGEANVLVFPNLTAGNIFAHSMLQFSRLSFDFTLGEGMAKPVGVIGRSVPVDVAENVIVSCAMQANS